MPDLAAVPSAAPPSPAMGIGGAPGLTPRPPAAAGPAQAAPQMGPGVQPQANLGLQVQAMQQLNTALKQMQEALPNLPMGTPLHTEVLNAVKSLTKHMGDAVQQGQDVMHLLQMARQAQQAQPMQTLMKAYPQQGPGGQPALPPPAAPPAMGAPA